MSNTKPTKDKKFKAIVFECQQCKKTFFAKSFDTTYYCPCSRSWVEQRSDGTVKASIAAFNTKQVTYL